MEKYIEWKCVESLIELMEKRDSHYDWSDEYEKYHKKIKKSIEWMKNNTKEF